jgi:hypothetical protein
MAVAYLQIVATIPRKLRRVVDTTEDSRQEIMTLFYTFGGFLGEGNKVPFCLYCLNISDVNLDPRKKTKCRLHRM